MRVTHVAPTLFGEDGVFGGGERYPLELARALASRVPTRLVSFGSRALTYREDSGLEVVILKRLALMKGHPVHPLATGLRAATRDADVVHVHHMRSAPGRLAALIAKARRQRVVVTDHGLGGGGWFGLLPRMFDAFLTVSHYSAITLRAPADKVHVVYGGCDIERFRPDEGPRDGVLFVGRITPHKGIDRLIRALPQGASLTIAGTEGHDPRPPESNYGSLLRDLARSREVSFKIGVSDRELPLLYRRARLLVLPSVHVTCYGKPVAISELLGLTVLEAMASATPVVCSRVGGLPEIVPHGRTGYLVEPGDEVGLRERIQVLLEDDSHARRLGGAARELVRTEFSWDTCAERCLDAYALK